MSRPYDYTGTPGGGSYYSVNNGDHNQAPIYSPAHANDSSTLLAQNNNGGSGGAYPPGGGPVPKPYGGSGATPWYKKPAVLWTAAIIIVVAIAAGVGGGIAGSKSKDKSSDDTKGLSGNAAEAPLAAGTDANGNPVYTATASASAPTATGNAFAACASSNPTYTTTPGGLQVRTDHPRLFADQARWDCLPQLIKQDAYMSKWNDVILANASRYADMDPVQYTTDGGLGGSGVLDIARELQLRTKHWAYAWRLTKDQKWVDRTWRELQVASGNSPQPFGADGTRWNPLHFLDTAEFTAAFAFSYDWMYDAWSADQRNSIRESIVTLGLRLGLSAYTDTSVGYGWWRTSNGNWNNVCNGGLTLGALAVVTEDTTNTAQQLLSNTIANVKENGVMAVSTDGTWSETSDYWYFGNHGLSNMVGALRTATGSDQGILDANPSFNLTGWFHIYGTGFVEKFNYGDCGPNKYVATANALFLYGDHFNLPRYPLYQRDREDAADPLSMLWYNPGLSGEWWYNLPLDRHFPTGSDAWASMRSSWTDGKGLYAAIKAGDATGHQSHGNLDAGTFVLEALGQRFAGELCQNDYLAPEYFKSEAQNAMRWTYYRCMTEGQNTLSFNGQNQIVSQTPRTTFASTGDQQQMLDSPAPANSSVFFWTDLSSTYGSGAASAVRRGMRLYNQRRQVLVRDEIEGAQTAGQWRMHTNATITYSNNNRVATLALGGETMTATILDSSPNVSFQTLPATRTSNAPPLGTSPDGEGYDLPNPGVQVLAINFPAGATTLEVLFNPQWEGLSASDYKTPPNVPLSSWSLTSHP